MFVFRFGKLIEYDELYSNPSWSNEQLMKAASFYATCVHYGKQNIEAYSLSFMYVSMENQPETDYPTTYKNKIDSIINIVEKASLVETT